MEKKEAFKKIASEREQSELAQGLPGVSGLSKWGLPAAGVIVVLLGLWAYLAFFHATFGIGSTVYLYIDADDTPDSVRVKIKNTARPGISAGFPVLSALSGYTVKSGCYAVEPEDNMFTPDTRPVDYSQRTNDGPSGRHIRKKTHDGLCRRGATLCRLRLLPSVRL